MVYTACSRPKHLTDVYSLHVLAGILNVTEWSEVSASKHMIIMVFCYNPLPYSALGTAEQGEIKRNLKSIAGLFCNDKCDTNTQ